MYISYLGLVKQVLFSLRLGGVVWHLENIFRINNVEDNLKLKWTHA